MNKTKHHPAILAAALAAALALSAPVMADNGDGWFGRGGMMGQWFKGEMMGHHMMHGGMMDSRVGEERLTALKSALGITEAQNKAWDEYAAAVTAASSAMHDAHTRMMGGDAPETLPDRIALHDAMMAGHQETMKAVSAATLELYNALDPDQKKKADQMIMGMGMM